MPKARIGRVSRDGEQLPAHTTETGAWEPLLDPVRKRVDRADDLVRVETQEAHRAVK